MSVWKCTRPDCDNNRFSMQTSFCKPCLNNNMQKFATEKNAKVTVWLCINPDCQKDRSMTKKPYCKMCENAYRDKFEPR
jgi:hypothetical protein